MILSFLKVYFEVLSFKVMDAKSHYRIEVLNVSYLFAEPKSIYQRTLLRIIENRFNLPVSDFSRRTQNLLAHQFEKLSSYNSVLIWMYFCNVRTLYSK
jgi:hypothetical protein